MTQLGKTNFATSSSSQNTIVSDVIYTASGYQNSFYCNLWQASIPDEAKALLNIGLVCCPAG
jgi:hypothetical protein